MLDTLTPILTEPATQSPNFFTSLAARQGDAKSPGDLVSDADRAVEPTLRQRLTDAFPDCTILGEECGGEPSDHFGAIDPIDGTRNFLSGLPFWTISLGLIDHGQPTAGAIIAPALGHSAVGTLGQPLRTTGFTPGSRPADPPCLALCRAAGLPSAFKLHDDGTTDVLAGAVFDIAQAAGWRGEILNAT